MTSLKCVATLYQCAYSKLTKGLANMTSMEQTTGVMPVRKMAKGLLVDRGMHRAQKKNCRMISTTTSI